MLDQISAFLEKNPGTKAKTVAFRLRLERPEVSRLLHEHNDRFEQDAEFRWSLVPVCRVEFRSDSWLTARDFERALSGVSPLQSQHAAVVFALKDECKPLLAFIARLLALCNQLVEFGKLVTLDFDGSRETLRYLDRVGFFGVLASSVVVLPKGPRGELAKTYQGNNDGVVEFRSIDPTAPDQDIPRLLKNSFVRCAGVSYSQAAFTVLAELFNNVLEHSRSNSAGFAGLQFYPKGKSIQAVISDNGLGIIGTLAPVLPDKYPEVAQRVAASKHAGVALLIEVFSRGELSQVDSDGRGLGLKISGDVAEKFRATIAVRQSDFELRVRHTKDGIQFSHSVNLAHLNGTHICFEFKLD
jgi:hypothetical protein